MRARARAMTGGLLAAVLVVAGCGGDDAGDGGTDVGETATAAGGGEEPQTSTATATGSTGSDGTGTGAEASAVSCESDGEMRQVRFAPTAPLPAYWPYYYIAEPLGFYEDAGIDIEFVNAQTAVQQALLAGRLDVSGTGLDYFVQVPTFDDPPQWFMNVDRYLWVIATFADSDIQEVADLQGGKIGINEPHDTLDADFMLAAAGVPEGEYELIPVGEDRAALVALERGEIDAFVTAGAVSMVALADVTDRELKAISNPTAEAYYNMSNMVTLETLEGDRDLAVCFGRAVARGMIWAWENPQTAGELLYEVAPESADSAEQAVRFVEAGNEANRASYEERGRMDLAIVQDMIDKHVELGFLEQGYEAETVVTNDLIDDIWDFDVDAEIERARNDER